MKNVLLFLLYCFFVVEIYSLSIGTYLFLDDTLIKSSNGLFFEQHQPTKKGQVIAPEYEWESGIYFYTSALKVSDNEYRLYYTCIGQYNIEVNTINLCMANSTDGITFQKPFLGVIGYGADNNTANNIVFSIPYSRYGGWPNTVWMDLNPNIPQVEKFKLTYDSNDSTRYLRIASSPDGINWKPIAQPGVADKFADTQSVIVWNLNTAHYVAYGRDDYTPPNTPSCPGNAADYRRIALSISSTNVSEFGPAEVVFSWDPILDPPCLDPYNPATLLYPTDPFVPSFSSPLASPPTSGFVPNVYLLFPAYTYHLSNSGDPYTQQFGINDNLLDIHFIFSHNGRNFSYVTKEPFIPRGFGYRNLTSGMFDLPNSEWDAGMVFMTRGIFVTPSNPNTLTLYYYGSQMTHTYAAYIHNALYNQPKGLGRAEIRRDGFVSLTTQYNLPMPQASLLTVPITIPEITECGNTGIELQLNIETSVSGFVTVQILDSSDQPIQGYTTDECVPIKGNFVRVPVFWNSNGGFYSDLTKLAGNTVSLSFSMSHTKLYAMEFVCASQSFP